MRELLGIPLDGRGVFSHSITIYFEADLAAQMLGKPISVVYINNPRFGGSSALPGTAARASCS